MLKNITYKKILILFSSQTIAQLLPLLISPIISRLYGPEEFGVIALFIALAQLISTASTLRLEMAVPISESYEEAVHISILSFISTFLLSILGLVVLLILKLCLLLGDLSYTIIFFIPFTTILIGFGITLNYFNLKMEHYKRIGLANISRSLSQSSLNLIFGGLGMSKIGLLVGFIASSFMYTFRLTKCFFTEVKKIESIDRSTLISVLRKHKKFPLFSFWASLLNNLSLNSTVFFISLLFKKTEVGIFSFANKYISSPLNIIGGSISSVFFEEASKININNSSLRRHFYRYFTLLIVISMVLFVPIYIWGENLFPVVFGEKWRLSGTVIKYLSLLLALKFISNPLSFVLIAKRKQEVELRIQILFLVVNILIWFMVIHFSLDFLDTIYYYSLLLSGYYLAIIMYLNFFILRIDKSN